MRLLHALCVHHRRQYDRLLLGLISGVVALNLATRAGSMFKLFMACVFDVVRASVDPIDGPPPVNLPPGWQEAKDEFLAAHVPADVPEQKILLEKLIMSNVRSEWIRFYKVGG